MLVSPDEGAHSAANFAAGVKNLPPLAGAPDFANALLVRSNMVDFWRGWAILSGQGTGRQFTENFCGQTR